MRAITTFIKEIAIATAAISTALLLRLSLDPMLGNETPLATIYGAVAVTVFFARWPVALAAAVAGYLAGNYLFMSPRYVIELPDIASRVVFLDFSFSCALIILMGELLRRARDTASRNAGLLQDRQRHLERFIAVLSHELRSPISAAVNALSVLRQKDAPEIWKSEALDIAERQTAQVGRLVDDLMDVARITSGKLSLIKSRVELLPVLRHAVETSQPLLTKGRHSLALSGLDEPVVLDCDSARISQVVSNLITNAAKFSPDGTPIEVNVTRDGAYVRIGVRDYGAGIAAERLRNRFSDLASTGLQDGNKNDGLGLGLEIVQRLTAMHGGRVEVQSAGLNKGAEFAVILPCENTLAQASLPAQPRLNQQLS